MTNPLLPAEWIARFQGFKRLIVGFSGGLDSTVLVHALASVSSLSPRLLAVHINHGISPNAMKWQQHCERIAAVLKVPFMAQSVQFNRSANIEEGARTARYAVFSSLLGTQDCLLLGHHQDDQAETILLQLFRGAGVDGLASMREFCSWQTAMLARPFLTHSRQILQDYALAHQLQWIEDESNHSLDYSRNYLRHQIMPLLMQKWPGVVGNLARTAVHCQQAQTNLHELAIQDCAELSVVKPRENMMSRGLSVGGRDSGAVESKLFLPPLKQLSTGRLTNVIRAWLRHNDIQAPTTALLQRLIDELVFASQDAMPLVAWDNVQIRRYQEYLYLEKVDTVPQNGRSLVALGMRRQQHTLASTSCTDWLHFPEPCIVPQNGMVLCAQRAEEGVFVPEGAKISIRFRQGGERFFWHGHHKYLKKLLQEWGVAPWLREQIPLVYIDDQLAVVVGYAISDFFYSTASPAWFIELSSDL